jgi:hypothetical protein
MPPRPAPEMSTLWSQVSRAGKPCPSSVGTAVTGRALNRYNAGAAIRKRAHKIGKGKFVELGGDELD